MKHILLALGCLCIVIVGLIVFLSWGEVPSERNYGDTFRGGYGREIGIDWRASYIATLDELGVKQLRIPAYWSVLEREKDAYDWSELDFYMTEAQKRNAQIVLTVGRRIPRWPECHVPTWAQTLPWEEQKRELRQLLTAIIERYRHAPNIAMWQIENEVFLPVFADESCGHIIDEPFLDEEIALVRSLDERPILVTDSGNLGLWYKPYRLGDVFGTSMYLYFFRPDTGMFRTILPSRLYTAKLNLMRLVFGEKPAILSELSLEPWLADSIENVSIEEQRTRMNLDMVHEILAYAAETPFSEQYLWGVEWWYYMRERGYPEYWAAMKVLFHE